MKKHRLLFVSLILMFEPFIANALFGHISRAGHVSKAEVGIMIVGFITMAVYAVGRWREVFKGPSSDEW